MEIKIKLKIKNIEIELTKDEAKELFDFLRELYGKDIEWKTIPIYIEKWKEYYPEWPYYPNQPIWCGDTNKKYTISYTVSNT